MALALASVASAHDGSHPAGPARPIRIDPTQSYRFDVVAAAGGHFHALLATNGGLLAGTHLGLFGSEDRGLTWRLVDRRLGGVDVHALARDATSGRLFAATHDGLFVSDDGGRRWRDDSRGLPGRDLHALTVDRSTPANVYVWEVRHGLLKQTASSKKWEHRAKSDLLPPVESLAVNPADQQRFYAGTAKGVWVSHDGGRRWARPVGGLYLRAAGVIVLPGNPGRLLAATIDGVFEGVDDGERWRRLPSPPSFWGPLVAFALCPVQRDGLLAVSHEGVVARHASGDEPWVPLPLAAD